MHFLAATKNSKIGAKRANSMYISDNAIQIASFLITRGADIISDAALTYETLESPLHYYARSGPVNLVEFVLTNLIPNANLVINKQNKVSFHLKRLLFLVAISTFSDLPVFTSLRNICMYAYCLYSIYTCIS